MEQYTEFNIKNRVQRLFEFLNTKTDEKPQTFKKIKQEENAEEDKQQQTLDHYRKKSMKNSMKHDESKFDDEMYQSIDDNDLNFCGKQILKQTIEHPETAYKQVRKLEKCQEELDKSGKNTVNYTDPEARKSPNKENHTNRL